MKELKTCDCGNYFKNEHEEEIGFCGNCRWKNLK